MYKVCSWTPGLKILNQFLQWTLCAHLATHVYMYVVGWGVGCLPALPCLVGVWGTLCTHTLQLSTETQGNVTTALYSPNINAQQFLTLSSPIYPLSSSPPPFSSGLSFPPVDWLVLASWGRKTALLCGRTTSEGSRHTPSFHWGATKAEAQMLEELNI